MIGKVHSLETFGLVDGPGVRYVAFLSGCYLRCQFCHNPDTWDCNLGKEYTPKELADHAIRYKNYWRNNGGVTVSGGEPLIQMEFVTEFFQLLKEKEVHTTLDTAGQPFNKDPEWLAKFDALMEVTDLVMLDLKDFDATKHKELTGWTNENILEMAKYLSDHGKEMWIRHVLVPGVTDDEEDLKAMRRFIDELKTVTRVEILPYHTMGTFKWEKLGIPYPLEGVRPPSDEEVARAEEILIPEGLHA